MAGDIQSELYHISCLGDQKTKIEHYRQLLFSIISSNNVPFAKSFIEHMVSDDVALVISRQLLQLFSQQIVRLEASVHKEVAQFALTQIQPRVVSFEEQATTIREGLAEVLEKEEEWSQAALMLSGIDLDGGGRGQDLNYRLSKCIKIALLYLEDDDAINAETYIKKASFDMGICKNEVLELQYKGCYARILDSKRKFLEAALKYYDLSKIEKRNVFEDDLEQALRSSIICSILASAGPQRSRVLSTLYKDERCSKLEIYPILQKVYLERILQKSEVDSFSEMLKPHQKAVLGDGSTVLDRSIMEHNLLSASKIYSNISFDELGNLLGIDSTKAERVAARMVSEFRMKGSIDQVESFIYFDNDMEVLQQWDNHISDLCLSVNHILDSVSKKGLPMVI